MNPETIRKIREQYRMAALVDIAAFGDFDPMRALRNMDRPVSEVVAEAIDCFSRRGGGDAPAVTP